MKKSLITFIGAATLSAAVPVLAGPDWQVIEHARSAKQAAQEARQENTRVAKTQCVSGALMLALDHGPRAQTTPHRNRLREQEQARTCA
jgi:hypothetical protein